MSLICPECGGVEIVREGDGYARCDSSRRHSPRGPQDVFDGRRCGTVFWVGLSDQDRRRAAASRDAEAKWQEWTTSMVAALQATTEPERIAYLINRAATELQRGESSMSGLRIPPDVYKDAWSRLAASERLVPSHELLSVQTRRVWGDVEFALRSRRSAWRCDPADLYYVDADGASFEEAANEFVGPVSKDSSGMLVIGLGAPCKMWSRNTPSAGGSKYTWGATDAKVLTPLTAAWQDNALPALILGLVGQLVD
jgi:hypothetical protein